MGKFAYDSLTKIDIEDRALAHVQLVITTKLRRGESFTFTWKEDISVGGGRSSVWIHPTSILHFKYHGSRQPQLNKAWLEALTYTANQPTGLYLVHEPAGDVTEPESATITG